MATDDSDPDGSEEYNPDLDSWSDYRERIEMMADEIEEAIDNDPTEFGDGGRIHDLIHEEVDASRMVIYTHEALAAIGHARANPTEWEQYVAEGDSWGSVLTTMAYLCVREDLNEELHRRGAF